MKRLAMLTLSMALAAVMTMPWVQRANAHNSMKKAPSPHAVVTQSLGAMGEVTIDYHRPAVKEREIWGKQVKYGELWSPGANQNTTIAFDKDVVVNGEEIAAGTYGFHTIPSDGDWILVFSNNSKLFRSLKYNEEEDALRITVTPEEAPHSERLTFAFEDLTINGATVFLHWEKLKVKFTIHIPMEEEH